MQFTRWIPSWSTLSRVGRSRALATSFFWLFFVPLAAFLLAKLPESVSLPFVDSEVRINVGLPFSWRMFYFAAVAFSAATLLYSARCPTIVRKYDRYSDFSDEGRGPLQVFEALLACGVNHTDVTSWSLMLGDKLSLRSHPGVKFVFSADTFRSTLANCTIEDEAMPMAFWLVHQMADSIRLWSRLGCTVCYAIGFALISVVVGQNFLYVWRFVGA